MSEEESEMMMKRLALEDYIFKSFDKNNILLSLDRLTSSNQDDKKNINLITGAKGFVEWYGNGEISKNNIIISGTKVFRKDFSKFINSIKK